MNILIIDRQDITAQMVRSKLEPAGHRVHSEPSREAALDLAKAQQFDVIFIDPAPLTSARQVILDFRRKAGGYSYIVVLGENGSYEEAIKAGANNFLSKPIDPEALQAIVQNAGYLGGLVRRIGDEAEDFPNAGGVISKSAFNQLFLSALERADRYGERTFVLFISISNSQNILEMDGGYAAGYAAANLSKALSRLRRQSDIIAQTGKYEYALLLQRPIYETEPMEAANRFVTSLSGYEDLVSEGGIPLEIDVSLVALPCGSRAFHHLLKLEEAS